MLQVLQKWVVKVYFTESDSKPMEFVVNEIYLANVLNVLAKLSFEKEVFKVEIWKRKDAPTGNIVQGA